MLEAIGGDSEPELYPIQEDTRSEVGATEGDAEAVPGGASSSDTQPAPSGAPLAILAIDTLVDLLRTQEPAGSRSCELLRISSICSWLHGDHNEPEYYCPTAHAACTAERLTNSLTGPPTNISSLPEPTARHR